MAEPREASIRVANVSDQAAAKDSLGFEPYVMAIAEFLTNPDTQPPLTLSVEGSWGSGKSSFMKQLQQAIEEKTNEPSRLKLEAKRRKCWKNVQEPGGIPVWRPDRLLRISVREFEVISRELTSLKKHFSLKRLVRNLLLIGNIVWIPLLCLLILIYVAINFFRAIGLTLRIRFLPKPRVVWFNAWRHDKAEALWAAFALTFLEEISKNRNHLDFLPTLCGHIKLFLSRFERKGCLDLLRTIAKGALLLSAIVLILFFIIFRGSHWADQLSSTVSRLAGNPGSSQPAKVVCSKGSIRLPVGHFLDQENQQSSPQPSSIPQVGQICSSTNPSAQSNSDIKGSDSDKKDLLKTIIAFIKDSSWLVGILGSGGVATLYLFQQLQKVIGDPKKELTEYLKSPDYDSQVSFIENFHADFKKIVDAYAGKGNKVYVFIDDLDRCEVPKSAELMQALNLMISNDPKLIFILGMDREKVAAGLAVKHKEVIPYLSSSVKTNSLTHDNHAALQGVEYGYTFIEKFVQLPFLVPQPSQVDFEMFLDKLAHPDQPKASFWQPIQNFLQHCIAWIKRKLKPESDQSEKSSASRESARDSAIPEETAQLVQWRLESIKVKTGSDSPAVHNILTMVAPTLDWNPRRLKQFLNLFRLRAFIASATGLFDEIQGSSEHPLTLEQLGKFTAIGLKYPLLSVDIAKDDKLLTQLQRYALQEFIYDLNNTTQYWGSEPKLLNLLRYGCSERDTPDCLKGRINYLDYSFEQVKVGKLLQVSPRIHPLDRIPLHSEKDIDYRNLRNLLKVEQWRKADEETYRVMLKVAGREKQRYLDIEDIQNFPCKDLQTIDQLWIVASKGKFGFSVQKKIWEECGSPMEYNEAWEKFGGRVGWRKKKDRVDYDELIFNQEISLPGELPVRWNGGGKIERRVGLELWNWKWEKTIFIECFSSLSQRLVDCSR